MRGEFPDYHSVVRDICEAAKVKPNEDVIEELYQERLAEKSFGFRQLDAVVVNMITQLRELGYLVTVVSNTTHDEVDSWTSCQLGKLISDPIFSFAVGSMKPEPKHSGDLSALLRRPFLSAMAAVRSWPVLDGLVSNQYGRLGS